MNRQTILKIVSALCFAVGILLCSVGFAGMVLEYVYCYAFLWSGIAGLCSANIVNMFVQK